MLKLRDELELKVNVLSLPVDICVQQALQGNSALQGALNVALKVLQDIEDFEANLQQQEIDLVNPWDKFRLTYLLAMCTYPLCQCNNFMTNLRKQATQQHNLSITS